MGRRFQPRSTPAENLRIVIRSIPWRIVILLPMLILAAIPAFYYGTRAGQKFFPTVTNYFYTITGPAPTATPTPLPSYSSALPQVGSLLYTTLAGDSCDEILAVHMHMADAGTIFTDTKPNTIQALDAALGQDCHALQPGMVLTLSPQYPLVALGGQILTVDPVSPQQVLPTPVINVARQQQLGADCSGGCQLAVRIAPGTEVHLFAQTTLPVKVGSWVWAQTMLARKKIQNFDAYPYADPLASFKGMALRACDLQIDNTHDDNSLSCDQLLPNTIDDDGGAWLFGVVGASSLDHWGYPLHLPEGTRVLLWLSSDSNGNLKFHKGNEVLRYDETTHVYVNA